MVPVMDGLECGLIQAYVTSRVFALHLADRTAACSATWRECLLSSVCLTVRPSLRDKVYCTVAKRNILRQKCLNK